MNYSQTLLTSFKAANGGCSDYEAAKKLGCSRQYISKIKKGSASFSEEKVVELSKITGLDLKKLALEVLLSSVKTDEMRQVLEEIKSDIKH